VNAPLGASDAAILTAVVMFATGHPIAGGILLALAVVSSEAARK